MKKTSIAIIMITLNEGHNLPRVFSNLKVCADEIFVLDSYSHDNTIDICLENEIEVIQKKFTGFGDQWNSALSCFNIKSDWVMKLDPDEVISEELKENIIKQISLSQFDGLYLKRRLWFMGKPLPVNQRILRIWKKGLCTFSDSLVNEYPSVKGSLGDCKGELKHFDSPNLDHWINKQNKYTTAEAKSSYLNLDLADVPNLFGNSLQRRMFIKSAFYKIPFRYQILFLYHYLFLGAFKAGYVGYIWSRLRCDVYRMTEYKLREFKMLGEVDFNRSSAPGRPDPRCKQL